MAVPKSKIIKFLFFAERQIALANLSEKSNKYFPPVGRIDNVFGDRNLVCSCPPIEAYEHEQT